jgi:hypothetical protein
MIGKLKLKAKDVSLLATWGSVVNRATGYGLDGREFESRQRQDFSLLYVAQTGSEAYQASCTMGTAGGDFLRG